MEVKKIQINYLAHFNREKFFRFVRYYLVNIKEENKKLITFHVHQSTNNNFWKSVVDDLNKNEIESYMVGTGSNYMKKITNSLNTECEYSCSMDDDIILNNYLWDFLIENINVLDERKNLFLAPLISNGIPSTDYFIEDFMNDEDKKIIHDIYKNTYIPPVVWGADYSHLNDYKMTNDKWDFNKFYDGVYKINHYYKGIHPVRISKDGQTKLAEIIVNNFDKFKEKGNYKLDIVRRPYFCNSFYFLRSDVWRDIILDSSLYRDPYDEVPLNLYKDKHDLNMVFVRNGYCIHMAYNSIAEQVQIQDYYYSKLISLEL